MLIYVGQPYTHKDPKIRQERYELMMKFLARQLIARQSLVLYAPIVHWHTVAEQYSLPTEAEFWWKQNKVMLGKADMLWVLQIPGWKQSEGLKQEITYAFFRGIPIEHKDPV